MNKSDVCVTGRWVGGVMLIQVALGMLVNLYLIRPLVGEAGFLVSAADHAVQLGVMVLVASLAAGLGLAVAILVSRAADKLRAGAPWLLGLAAVAVAASVMEQVAIMSMVSASQVWQSAEPAQRELLEALGKSLAAERNWRHYFALIITGVFTFAVYLTFWYSQLLNRLLVGFGVLASLLQIVAVSQPLLGGAALIVLLAPIGLCQIIVGGWLLVRGFDDS